MSLAKEKSVALYQSIAEENKERIYKHWHASSLAICPRAHYFKRLGISTLNKPTGAKILRWTAGHLMEEAIRNHVAKVWGNGQQVHANQRFTSERLDLTGEFDNLAVANGTLIEIKTVHDYAIIERNGEPTLKQASGELNKWGKPAYEPMLTPYEPHEIQNHGYVLLLEEHGIKVNSIDYAYITLGGRIVTYHTSVSPEIKSRVEKRLDLLNKAWTAKVPPECLCSPNDPLWSGVYQWCDYRQEATCCDLNLIKKVNA